MSLPTKSGSNDKAELLLIVTINIYSTITIDNISDNYSNLVTNQMHI